MHYMEFDHRCKEHEFPFVGDDWTHHQLGEDECFHVSIRLPIYDSDIPAPTSKDTHCIWCQFEPDVLRKRRNSSFVNKGFGLGIGDVKAEVNFSEVPCI